MMGRDMRWLWRGVVGGCGRLFVMLMIIRGWGWWGIIECLGVGKGVLWRGLVEGGGGGGDLMMRWRRWEKNV